MPYFLRVDNEGVARIGGTFRARPGDDWHQGSESNYLQRWDGSQWVDTPIAELLRQAQATDAVANNAEKKKRQKDEFRSRENRPNRIMMKIIAEEAGLKWSKLLDKHDAAMDADAEG